MKANYETQCPACLNWINPGDEIVTRLLVGSDEPEWIHAKCDEAEEGPLPEFGGNG